MFGVYQLHDVPDPIAVKRFAEPAEEPAVERRVPWYLLVNCRCRRATVLVHHQPRATGLRCFFEQSRTNTASSCIKMSFRGRTVGRPSANSMTHSDPTEQP